jgi:NAD(P)-dependent dehydrogenase (short-subunit alcohol dehydrogenase family)
MADFVLAGKRALVTGGAGGIGRGCATALARDGCELTLMGRTEKSLEAAAERIKDDVPGARVGWFAGDGTVAADVEAAVAAAVDAAGRLDICIATVGGGTISPLLALSDDTFQNDLRRNIVSAFLAIKYCTPPMVEAGGGSIVCISSDVAKLSWPLLASYCAAKAGLDGLVRTAADELGSLNIRVNAVRPGLTRTDSGNVSMVFTDPELIEEFVRQKPLGRTGTPQDIAAGVRYLAGPEASWVTGQSLAIEGGNELRRAPSLEKVARLRLGDDVVDAAQRGIIPSIGTKS